MELDTLSQIENPGLRIRRFPRFRQFRDQLVVFVNLGQIVPQLAHADIDHVRVHERGRVQTVTGSTASQGLAQCAALVGRSCQHGIGERGRHRQDNAQRDSTADEVPTGDSAPGKAKLKFVDLFAIHE